jgi:hypothetical protein
MRQVEYAIAQTGGWFEPVVLLAADSRFSRQGMPPLDDRQKLYVLSSDMALVYSGDVLAAERAIRGIKADLPKRRPGNAARGDDRGHRRNHPRGVPARGTGVARRGCEAAGDVRPAILLGYCAGHDSGIARFSKNANFHPIYLLGIEATGPTAAVEYFE